MINSSLSSTEGLIKENIQYSSSSVTTPVKHIYYNRHHSSRYKTRSLNRKPRKIIHVTIRPPKNNRHPEENKSTHPTLDLCSIPSGLISLHSQHNLKNSDIIPNSTRQTRNATHSLRADETSRSHPLKSQVFTKTNANVFGNNNETMKKEDWSSNIKDLLENSGKRKKKKCPNALIHRCTWVIVFLVTALLLGAAIAGALAATLIKSDTTTTISTTLETTTTISTTSTTTITSSTVTTISFTATVTISSTTTISTTEITSGTTTTATSTSSITATTVQTIITASPSSSASSYFGTDTVEINCPTTITLTNITIEIFVPITNGATYNDAYDTYWTGAVTASYTTNGTYIIYTWLIASGQTITCSSAPYTFSAEFNSNGTARVTSDDTYIMTATTSSGVTNTLSGHF